MVLDKTNYSTKVSVIRNRVKDVSVDKVINDFLIPEDVFNGVAIDGVFNLHDDLLAVSEMFATNDVITQFKVKDLGLEVITHFLKQENVEKINVEIQAFLTLAAGMEDTTRTLLASGLTPVDNNLLMTTTLPGNYKLGLSVGELLATIYPNTDSGGNKYTSKSIVGLTTGNVNGIINLVDQLMVLIRSLEKRVNYRLPQQYEADSATLSMVLSRTFYFVENDVYAMVTLAGARIKSNAAIDYAYNSSVTHNLKHLVVRINRFISAIPATFTTEA